MGLNSMEGSGPDELNLCMDWNRYFFHSVSSGGPILVGCQVNNAAAIPRTFASLQRSAIRSRGREIPRTIACLIWCGMQRPGFRPNSGLQIVRSPHPMRCRGCESEGRGGAEFCGSRFGFSLGRNPKERAWTRGTESEGEGRGECYQTCYHFLEKAARNRMNQGPPG